MVHRGAGTCFSSVSTPAPNGSGRLEILISVFQARKSKARKRLTGPWCTQDIEKDPLALVVPHGLTCSSKQGGVRLLRKGEVAYDVTAVADRSIPRPLFCELSFIFYFLSLPSSVQQLFPVDLLPGSSEEIKGKARRVQICRDLQGRSDLKTKNFTLHRKTPGFSLLCAPERGAPHTSRRMMSMGG